MQKQITIWERAYVRVQVDLTARFLTAHWLKEPSTLQYKAVVGIVVIALLRYKIMKILINSQAKGPLTFEEQTWFLSKARRVVLLHQLKKVAYVHSSDLFQQLIGEKLSDKLSVTKAQLEVKFFFSEAEALEWLRS